MTNAATSPHPTLDEIWARRSAPTAFPAALVEGATTAASFFSASFYGRNDVIYLDYLKVPDIVLVDIDRDKLAVMAKLYPTVMETFAEDAFEVAARLRAKGRVFDVVVCDPYEGLSASVLEDHFDTFAALVGRHWVTGVSLDTLAALGARPTLDGVQQWLDERGRREWAAVWLEVRNPRTGLAWLGLRRVQPAPSPVPQPAQPPEAEPAVVPPSPESVTVSDAPPEDLAAADTPAPVAGGSMWSLIDGGIRSYLVRAFVELELADRLDGGPRDPATLADEVGAPVDTLRRFLRAAQTIGLCALDPAGRVALTSVGSVLRRSDPHSMANWALLSTSRWFVRPWERLAEAIRTGRATFPVEFGAGMWEYMATHPEFATLFDNAMTGSAGELADSLLAAVDLSSAQTIVDVGGGEGQLVASLLARLPQARGIVADRAEVVAKAPEVLAAAGVADRVQLVPTDFRQAVPGGGDVYILSRILHDWPDADALEILRACRRSMPPTARLYLVEMVVPPDAHVPPAARYDHAARDLLMLVLMGGKERNFAEYRQLLVEAGFQGVRLLGERGIVIEATPSVGPTAPSLPQAFPTPWVCGAGSLVAFLPDAGRGPLPAVPGVDPGVVEVVTDDPVAAATRLAEQGRRFDVVVCDPADDAAERVLLEHFDTFGLLADKVWVTSIRRDALARLGIDPSLGGVQVWLDTTNRWDWEAAWLEVRDPATDLAWLALRRQAEEDKRNERPDLEELGRGGGAGLTVEHIWQARTSPAAFPRRLVSGARTAASFFSAMFYGRNDVIFLHREGVPEILINDLDEEKLAVMARVYPSVTEVVAGDAFAVAERMVQQGRMFDVVVCDSFDGWTVFDKYFETFAALARRVFITGELIPELREKGIDPTLAGIQAYLDAKGRHDWQITWLQLRRENTNIGALWMGFERRARPGGQPAGPSADER